MKSLIILKTFIFIFLKGFLVITGSVKDFIQSLDLFRVFRKSALLKKGCQESQKIPYRLGERKGQNFTENNAA